MKKISGMLKFCTAVAVAPFFATGVVACSDDSSASCAGSCVDSGDTIDITIPGDETSERSAAEEDWRDYCLEVVNAKRATEDLAPLVRATTERETCVEKQAAADMEAGMGHANFGDCGESAQNTGPNIQTQWYGTPEKIVDTYVNMMWDDEKKLVTSGERDPDNKDDYSYIGHYLNMKNTKYKSLACGIYFSADGKKAWFNMNFY